MNHQRNLYFSVSRGFLYLVPLGMALVTVSTLFPFIVGKYVWFRTCVDLALIFYLLGLLFQSKENQSTRGLTSQMEVKPRRVKIPQILKSPLVIAVSVFVGIFLLACLFGVNPSYSFWSNFERGEGGLQLLHLWLFFMLLITLFRDERDWRRLFGWMIAGGALSAIYGLFAGWGISNFIGPPFSESGFRFQGSIGNPAYVAAFALFLLSYTAYLFWHGRKRGQWFSAGNILLALLGVGFFAMFFSAATRGAFMGLIAAAVAFAGYFVFVHRRWSKWLIGGVAAVLLLVGTFVYFKDSPFVESIPGSRIFDISFSARTFEDRAIMWKIAWDGFQERPLLGWGPENFLSVFTKHFNPVYFRPAEGFGAWFDRAHSVYFDYLVEIGALGLLSFLAIFAVLYWRIFHVGRDEESEGSVTNGRAVAKHAPTDRISPFVGAFLFAVPVAYLVQGIVLFDVLVIYLNVFMFLAFAVYKLSTSTKLQIPNVK